MSKFKSFYLIIIAAVIALASLATACQPAAPAGQTPAGQTPAKKTYVLSAASVLLEGAAQAKALKVWGNELEKRTNGAVKIGQYTWGGALVKTPTMFENMRDRIADVVVFSYQYAPAKFPLSTALQPLFLDDASNMSYVQTELLKVVPELQAEYEKWNFIPVMWSNGANMALMTNFKFSTMEDLKAKKLRAVGAVIPMVKNIGAIPVSLGAAEVYEAMQKGTLDGVAGFPAYALISNKMTEVSRQVTDIRYGGYAMWFGIGMNKDAWDELPAEYQQVIKDIAPVALAAENQATEDDGMAGFKLARQEGVELVQLSPEEALKWQKAINPKSNWEDSLKAAEAAGFKNVRSYMDVAVKLVNDYNAKNPRKTMLERFFDLEKSGK